MVKIPSNIQGLSTFRDFSHAIPDPPVWPRSWLSRGIPKSRLDKVAVGRPKVSPPSVATKMCAREVAYASGRFRLLLVCSLIVCLEGGSVVGTHRNTFVRVSTTDHLGPFLGFGDVGLANSAFGSYKMADEMIGGDVAIGGRTLSPITDSDSEVRFQGSSAEDCQSLINIHFSASLPTALFVQPPLPPSKRTFSCGATIACPSLAAIATQHTNHQGTTIDSNFVLLKILQVSRNHSCSPGHSNLPFQNIQRVPSLTLTPTHRTGTTWLLRGNSRVGFWYRMAVLRALGTLVGASASR